ncbi:hypothetical protein IAQ61_007600 [Plenodomus lingam]|uniref:uncharacterized protein n=1 Tax=Leptosphaeria maculans TaxID=5022 RepID=UPI00332FD76C|nr:hypothetical protein IAQ61_007600 [Plenodomus lingam]
MRLSTVLSISLSFAFALARTFPAPHQPQQRNSGPLAIPPRHSTTLNDEMQIQGKCTGCRDLIRACIKNCRKEAVLCFGECQFYKRH